VRFLLALQRDIVSGVFDRKVLHHYCNNVLNSVIELVEISHPELIFIVTQKTPDRVNLLETLLRYVLCVFSFFVWYFQD
jgi:hypothetical protein